MDLTMIGPQPSAKPLTCDEVLRIAREDAERVYKDLSCYRIQIALKEDGWHIDYELTKPLFTGGGPYYVIDASTGTILWKKYYQ
jgi:hypothetical protein